MISKDKTIFRKIKFLLKYFLLLFMSLELEPHKKVFEWLLSFELSLLLVIQFCQGLSILLWWVTNVFEVTTELFVDLNAMPL